MIYNNLLIFLTAIFLFSFDTVSTQPLLSGLNSLMLFLLLLFSLNKIAHSIYSKPATFHPSGYFKAEKKLYLTALAFYIAALHLCDIKYHLSFLSIHNQLPAFVNIGGLSILFLFFSVIWQASSNNYQMVFGHERKKKPSRFQI